MADTYNSISNVAFVLAAIFLLITSILFFRFDITKIVGDLSGRNARKSISAMKNNINTAGNIQPVIFSNINSIFELEDNNYATAILGENEHETTVLSEAELRPDNLRFIIEEEITFVHTHESLL